MKKGKSVEGVTINTTPPAMSPLATIFHDLSLENKHAYFKDRYGTVKGTTGFFDYRFKQGIKDVKTFTQEDGTIIDACITLGGGNYERGAGSDSSNGIVVYIDDKAFVSGSVKYHEVTYYSGGSKKENYTASDDYQEILDCIFDPVINACTVMVKTGNNSSRPIVLEKSGKINWDEQLLGKLYIPTSIKNQKTAEDLSETLELETKEAEKYKSETESRSKTDMYKEAFDVYVMNRSYDKALSILTENKISVGKINTSKVLSLAKTHLDQCNSYSYGSTDTFYKYEALIDRVSNKEMKKKLATTIIDAILNSEKGGYKSMISLYMKLADIVDGGAHTLYQDYFCKNLPAFNLEEKDIRELLDLLSQGKKENYQLLYDTFIQQGGLRKFIGHYINSYITELNTTLQTYFESKGIENTDLFPTSYKVKKQNQYVIVAATNWISKGLVTPEKVKNVLSEVLPKDISEVLGYKDIEWDKKIEAAKSLNLHLGIEYSDEFVHILSDRLDNRSRSSNHENAVEELLTFLHENELVAKVAKAAIEKHHMRALESFDKKGLLVEREQIIGYGKACYIKGRHDKMKAVFEKFSFTAEEQAACVDVPHAESSVKEHSDDVVRLAYISHEKAVELIENYSDENRKSFCNYREEYVDEKIADHLSVLLSREDISSEYINNTLSQCYESKQNQKLKRLLMSGSIKIDKTLINKRIGEQIELGDIQYAKKIASLGGLISIRGKKIAILEVSSGKLGTRDTERQIKEHKLSKEYYSYLLNSLLSSNDIEAALKLSEAKDIIITKKQFDACRARIEKKNKQE